MEIKTINVVEYFDHRIFSLRSFPLTEYGAKEAEEYFRELVIKRDPDNTEEEIKLFIRERVYKAETYQVFIFYSHHMESTE